MWLLHKSTQKDGFQGWHQDMDRDLTETIVINLGSEMNDDELEMGNILHTGTWYPPEIRSGHASFSLAYVDIHKAFRS
jgi:hypothetical protein